MLFGIAYYWSYVQIFSNNNQTALGVLDWFVNGGFQQYASNWVSGHHALASNAQILFHWDEPCVVGNTISFTVKVFFWFAF